MITCNKRKYSLVGFKFVILSFPTNECLGSSKNHAIAETPTGKNKGEKCVYLNTIDGESMEYVAKQKHLI